MKRVLFYKKGRKLYLITEKFFFINKKIGIMFLFSLSIDLVSVSILTFLFKFIVVKKVVTILTPVINM